MVTGRARIIQISAFEHSDWLKNWRSQIRLLKTIVVKINATRSGPDPIKILQRKFYATLIFKRSDWLLKFFNQNALKIVA